MVQASEAWRANLRAEYILSQVGGRGRRRCGGEEDSDQRCQARCPAIFISKIFSQKIWPKNWGGSSNRKFREWFVSGSGPAPPRPPLVQMKNTPGGFFPRVGFSRRHSARAIDHWVGRSAAGYQFHAWVCHILATFDRPLVRRSDPASSCSERRAGPGCGVQRLASNVGLSAGRRRDESPCDINGDPRSGLRLPTRVC